MADRPETVSNEDIRKCGEEIKQLRNQQFVLGTTALGLFGAYAALLPRLSQISPAPSPGIFVWSAVAILVVFLLLFLWTRQLRVLIGVVGAWLEIVGRSTWEHDFRRYHAAHAPVSQTKLVSWSFLLLGLGVLGLVLAVTPSPQVVECWVWVVLGVVDALYLAAVIAFGFRKLGIDEARVRTNWLAIVQPAQAQAPSQTPPQATTAASSVSGRP